MFRGEKLFLEYERLHAICFQCGKYRYKKYQCMDFLGHEHVVVHTQKPASIPTKKHQTLSRLTKKFLMESRLNNLEGRYPSVNLVMTGFGPRNLPRKALKNKNTKPKVSDNSY